MVRFPNHGCGMGMCRFFFEWSERIIGDYPTLFEGGDETDGNEYSISAGFGKKWSAYKTLVILAGENPLEIDRATRLNVREALTYLNYLRDKGEAEREQYNLSQKT